MNGVNLRCSVVLRPSPTAGAEAETLTPRELLLVSAIAERITDLLRSEVAPPERVDAATLACVLGVSRDFVYAHADELGGQRIGTGPRGRLRFDLDQALAAWTSRSASKVSPDPESGSGASGSSSRRRRRMGSTAELLPIRGSGDGDRA